MSRFPASKMKRLMQSDEEIGKVAASGPPAVAKAVELFLEELAKASEQEMPRDGRILSISHVSAALSKHERFAFCNALVKEAVRRESLPKKRKSAPRLPRPMAPSLVSPDLVGTTATEDVIVSSQLAYQEEGEEEVDFDAM